jgi:foldase protein PrsA
VADYTGNLRQFTGLSEADVRGFIEADLYRTKLAEVLGPELATATEFQVHARHILVADEVLVKELQQRLKDGEAWDALAAEYSTDPSNAKNGGDLGWFGTGRMVAEFEQVAFATEPGTISDPVKTEFGWHLIQVLEKEERPLDSSALDQKRQEAIADWLLAKRAETGADGNLVIETFETWVENVPDKPDFTSFSAGQ